MTDYSKVLHPLGDDIGSVQLLDSMGTDKTIVSAARVSYLADNYGTPFDNKDARLIKHLLTANHGSVLEHCTFTFRISSPLFIIQQILRHRVGFSFNQSSRRYTVLDEDKSYTPITFRVQSKDNKQASVPATLENISAFTKFPTVDMWNASNNKIYQDTWRFAFSKYEHLLANGVAREQARGVLPVCQYGEFYLTANLRSLLHFLELRLEDHAQYEIRLLANSMLELIEPVYPEAIKIWKELHPNLTGVII